MLVSWDELQQTEKSKNTCKIWTNVSSFVKEQFVLNQRLFAFNRITLLHPFPFTAVTLNVCKDNYLNAQMIATWSFNISHATYVCFISFPFQQKWEYTNSLLEDIKKINNKMDGLV